MMTEYEKHAEDFLAKTRTRVNITRTGEVQGFPGTPDVLWRYKYLVTFTRRGKQFRVTFYDSHNNWYNNQRPSKYSILACLEKYPIPDSVEDFAWEFGYKLDTPEQMRQAKKIHAACKKEWDNVRNMFGDVLPEMREID